MALTKRPPHLLPGQNTALRSQILLDSPLELWRSDIARRGIFTSEKLAALAVVLGILFSQISFIVTPAEAAPDEITGTVFEDIAGDGLADGAIGSVNNPGLAGVPVSLFRDEAAAQTVDSPGEVGQYASIAIGSDGNPVVAYGDMSNGDLKVLHCDDPSCSTYTTTTADTAGSVGQSVSLAIGADGFPVISHYDWGNYDLRVYKCSNVACTAGSASVVDSTGSQGSGSSIAIGTDGLPIISYWDGTAYDLKVAHCNDAACASATITAIDTASTTGAWSSIAIGSDGLAVISYRYIPNADLKVAHCNNVACTSGTSTTVDTTGDLAGSSSIAQGSDGFPAVAYFDLTNRNLKFAHCTNLTCTTRNITTVDSVGDVGYHSSVAIGLDGNPIIAHWDFSNTALKLTYCDNLDCSSSSSTLPDTAGNVGSDPSMVLTAAGSPVVAYQDQGNYNLKILTAANGAPDAGDTPVATTTTDANGAYSFTGLSAGDYLVAVESTAGSATAGYDTAQTDSWAEQTYGPAGSLCADGLGGTLTRSTEGACYGGLDATTSDSFDSGSPDATAAEHVAAVAAGAVPANFGFSFNAVTMSLAGNTRDDAAGNRTVQGSLRQFIQNANAITGANAMRFVPAHPTNDFGGGGAWWRIAVSNALPVITGADTTIDGTAYDRTDGVSVSNPNPGVLGTGGTVGVDALALPQVAKPELELAGSAVADGLAVEAADATIRELSLRGFTSSAIRIGDPGNPVDHTGTVVEDNLIGSNPGVLADPGAGARADDAILVNHADDGFVQNNLVVYSDEFAIRIESSGTDRWTISGNEVRDNGLVTNGGLDMKGADGTASGNLVVNAGSTGAVVTNSGNVVENNTFENNGQLVLAAGVTVLLSSGAEVSKNILTGNSRAGVFVSIGATSGILITQNQFGGNASNAIDLIEPGAVSPQTTEGDGISPNTGAPPACGIDAGAANGGLDAPIVASADTDTVTGTACAGATVEVYRAVADGDASDTLTGTDYGEGVEYLGSAIADGVTGAWSLPGISGLSGGDEVSATATNASNSTSEFGANRAVVVPPPPIVIYWTEDGPNTVEKAYSDGSGASVLVSSLTNPNDLDVDHDGGKIYWTDRGTQRIQRSNLDGSGVENLVSTGLTWPVGLSLDLAAGKVYWTDRDAGRIQRSNLDGTGLETVLSGLSAPKSVAIDSQNGKMYWTDTTDDAIRRSNLDGTGIEVLVNTGLGNPNNLDLDVAASKMYWVDTGTAKIQRANLDGTGVEDLVTTGLTNPRGIVLDLVNDKIYWTDWGIQKIQRSNLDGSSVEDVITGMSTPLGIAIENTVNNAPVAVDDSDSTPQDIATVVDVLANDSDGDSDPMWVNSVTQGTNGSVANNGTNLTYTPDPAWTGVDTFTYTVSDGKGGTDTANVTITVDPVQLVVNSTGDGDDANPGNGLCETSTPGQCTLRAAIEEANALPGTDTINFNIPTSESGYNPTPLAFTIKAATLLPAISTPMVLDASTQPEYATEGRPVIEVDGADVSAGEENGFYLTGGGATLRGFVINNWGDDAIDIEFNGGNTVVGNYVGTNVTGTAAEPNAWGINFKTANNVIGGTTAADRNVVSGNLYDGFYIYTASATGNVIQGNYVGTNATGTAAVSNGSNGLYVWSGAHDNTIGGATAAHGNVISGNGTGEAGIFITGSTTSTNIVQNNYIGTNATGDAAIPNNLHGIRVTNAPDTQILDNLISGNDVHGVYVYDVDSTGTQILGNTIGTNAAVTARIDNLFDGVRLEGNSSGTIIGSAGNGNVVSGNAQQGVNVNSSSGNTIQGNFIGTDPTGTVDLGNTLSGVYFDAFSPSNNRVEGNTIAFNAEGVTVLSGWDNALVGNDVYSNDSLGIDLDDDGVTSNDGGDGDAGPNDLLNYPVITTAKETGGTVTVNFDLDVPNGDYRVEFFDNTVADGSGNGEGESFVSSVDVSVSGGVPTPGSHEFAGSVGDIITTTATSGTAAPFGPTSEFSAATTVTSGAFVVNSTGDLGDLAFGDGVCDTGGTVGSDPECTLRAAIGQANASAGDDVIHFDIPVGDTGHSGGVWTISPGGVLPTISTSMTIDGTTQPGWSSTPVVEINGISAGATSNGLNVNAADAEIRSLAVNRFLANGIHLGGSASNTLIVGNHIGLDASGLVDRGNAGRGIDLGSGSATVGGTNPADRNIISGNADTGIIMWNSDDNTVIGNYLGTDVTGNVPLPNDQDGIAVGGTSSNNIIGQSGAGNVMSGNGNDGLELDFDTTGTIVQGNTIGLGVDGDTVMANGRHGIILFDGVNNTQVGGSGAGEGNVISGNTESGVAIDAFGNPATTGNAIEGNHIGTDATGALDRGNGSYGIEIFNGANGNTIGGTTAAHRNVISGNGTAGVNITGTDSIVVEGNYIGLNAAGDAMIPNGAGVRISTAAQSNVIGGTSAGAGNVISGNTGDGVYLWNPDTKANEIIGNLIGTDPAGTGSMPNLRGVHLGFGAIQNTIGGATVAHRNVISGNSSTGVIIESSGATDNVLLGNYIGVDSTGAGNLGNGGDGIYLQGGASDNTIGGTNPGPINVIAYNGGDGIHVGVDTSDNNSIIRNTLHSNTGLGIDLDPNGVTTNDALDADTGPNDGLNFPEITSAVENGGVVDIDFDLDLPAGSHRVEFFTNFAADASGYGEGAIYVDSTVITHLGLGTESFSHAIAGSAGDIVTATTTECIDGLPCNNPGSTSEFSAAVVVASPNNPPTAVAGGPYTIAEGEDLILDGSGSSDPDSDPLTYTWDLDGDLVYDDASGVNPTVPWLTLVGLGIDDDGGPLTIGLHVDDGNTGTDTATGQLTVTNAAPDIIVTGSGNAVATNSYTVTVSVDDPGDDTVTDWTISWGDGTSTSTTGPLGPIAHVYVAAGRYDVTVSVVDEDGYWSDADLFAPSWEVARHLGRYDGSTGAFEAELASATTVNTLGEVEVGPDGLLYTSSYINGRIARFDPSDNSFVDFFVTTGVTGPLGLEFGPDGHLYVADWDNHRVRRYNGTTGADMGTFASNGALVNPTGLTFGPDGHLYVASNFGPNTVVRFNGSTGAYMDVFTSVGGASEPEDIEFGADGNLYVAYSLSHRVGRFDASDGSLIDYFVPAGLGSLDEASGIEWGPDGNLYVSSRNTHEVKKYDGGDGTYLGNFVSAGAGGLTGPLYATFLPDHQVNCGDAPDVTAPEITLIGANPQTIEVGAAYSELGATALDDIDGDITGSIVINSSAVNTAVLGSYSVTYDVDDAAGNPAVQVTRTVDVVDTTAPVLTLVGANPQTIEVGTAYSELGATASDNYDGDITGSIVINSAAVDTAVVGSYVVTYDVVDAAGNPASGFRTVNVVDTTVPVITLVGANPQVIEVGSAYSELGATASDNYDGDISGSIVINSAAVNTSAVGSYTVTYDVTDSEGNAATQVTRTVDVVDTGAPVITLLGSDPVTIEVGTPYTDAGATAWDVGDGDLTGSIVTVNPVDHLTVGSYTITNDVTDSQANAAAQVTRTVDVVDTTAPVITLVGANPQTIEVGTAYSELGATASDNYDGDITGSIVINSAAVNTSAAASYTVTYDVTDSEGNAATQVTRTVDVVDTTAPVITLVGANPQVIEVGSAYSELGATASDNHDGDITGSIVINSAAVNTSAVGSYTVTYDVTDSEGNAATQVTRTVDVVDTAAPVITLVGANPQTIEVGSAYSELGATAFDAGDGDLTGSIVINSSAVSTAVVGSYIVTYDVTDSEANAATQVTRTVDVVDTTIPVITLVGANPQTIEVGSGYSELGSTAFDVGDGDITGSIVIDAAAVNTAVVGSYIVTYDVTDSEGNAAVQVTRTVDVVDTTAPAITLVGANPQTIEVGTAYSESGATASDNYDGDITGSIVINSAAVNTAVVGSYVVTYNVADSEANAATQVIRTVDVVDTTAPVITLSGANPQTIEVGTVYSELGATASDNYDGDITGSILINSAAVNTSAVGSYTVTYDVTDGEGNAAIQVTRTVDVVDTTAPVVTLLGANPQTIEVNTAYSELGATASDNYDGDVTGSIVINASAVNTGVVGTYAVTYDVVDTSGNPASGIRTVDVVDTTVPVITLVGSNPQQIEVGSPYTELGATALDNYDGDISPSIIVDSAAVNTAIVGSYSVTYDVTDSEGNDAVQVTRTVDVVDTASPIITLLGANPQTIEVGSPYVELGATASDVGDGDLTGSIVIDAAAVNTAVVGSYVVTYDVTDSGGNPATQMTRTVDVVDTTAPVMTLVGANPQTIEAGASYVELGATAVDNYDGDISGSIAINAAAVNTAAVGSYIVTYDVTDSEGNSATQVTRTVDVVDTVPPVITLIGPNPQVIEVGTLYTEVGATAADTYDGDLTGSIVINSAAVNTAVVGSYVVTYDVTDSEGNSAVRVSRTVDVVDTTAPTITLLGANPQTTEVGTAYSELGATASDNYDGDITGLIVTNSAAVDTAVVGSYSVTYDVTDSEGNAATQVIRTVDVVDTTAPVITLVGANPQTIEVGSPYVELGATALDIGDGDISGAVTIDSAAVNTAMVGSYVVTYDATDSQGNPAIQVSRTVDVVDTTAPVISLVGANPQVIEVGSPYVEFGANALDNYDGDITGLIITDSATVDTGVVGSYVVTYDVTDTEGNPATQATRTVDVVDTGLPVVTLLGANPQTIEVGTPYTELGATALDNYDGDISGSIIINSAAVNTTVVGSYTVTYDVTDSGGNAAVQVTRVVDVVDTTAPVLTLVGANPQTIEVGSPYVELGATASDNYDGDITGSIIVNSSAVNISAVGSYIVTYDVADSSGNPASGFRTVDVVDTTAPVITLNGSNPQVIQVGSVYVEQGATALDNYDGDISGSIAVNSTAVNTTVLGSYAVTYDVTDSEGNPAVQVIRTVDVVDTTAPVITLVGADPQLITVGSPYVELGATAADNYDGDISGSIAVNSTAVNTAVVGSYGVTYDVVDSQGNSATQVIRTVDVVNAAPTLGLLASQTVDEGNPLTFTAAATDPDPTDTLTFSLSGEPAGATITAGGAFSWTPTEAQGPSIYSFDVVVTDAGGPPLSDSQTITVTVGEINSAPVLGAAGPYALDEQTPLVFSMPVSDSDLPANGLSFALAGEPAGANIDPATGSFSWTPTEAQGPGVYIFDVSVSDDGSPVLGDTVSLTVAVGEVNAAPVVADPGSQVSAEADVVSLTVAATDSDVPANSISYSATGLPDGLAINPITGEISGVVGYTANAGSPFAATVTVTDTGTPASTGAAVFTWAVADTNRNPVGTADTAVGVEDTTLGIAVLANDLDPDGDPVSVLSVTQPSRGAVVMAGSGIEYTPDPNYFGPDAFTYVATDGRGGTDSVSVSITVTPVNDAPALTGLTALTVAEGTLVTAVAVGSDVDGDDLAYSLSGAPAGAAIDPASGTFTWTPSEAQGPGVYTFDVVVTDDGTPALSATRSVTVDVLEVNQAPVIVNPGNQVSTENEAVLLAIVANDPDLPATSIRFAATGLPPGLSMDPASGTISGTVPFDAAAGSPYAVSVTATDRGTPRLSSRLDLEWQIRNTNRGPSALDITVFAEAGVPTSMILNGSDPDGDALSFSIATDPTQGTLLGGPRLYDYAAAVTATGSDSFTFIVSDGDLQATGTVTIDITPNLVPVGEADGYTIRRGGVLVVDAPGVVGNDRDPEGQSLAATIETYPTHGSVTLKPDGSFVYRNRNEDAERDVFTYRVSDGIRVSQPITVVITLEANVAPIVKDDVVTVDEDSSVEFYPLANDYDVNDETLSLSNVFVPDNGVLDRNLNGAVVYTPNANWNGTEVLTYQATDGDLVSSGTVTITVTPVNDAPTAAPVEVTGNSGETVIVDLRPYVADIDGDVLTFLLESPSSGSAVLVEPGVFEISLTGIVRDLSALTFVASDPDGEQAASVVTVFVRIPGELVGVPSLVGDDIGGGPDNGGRDSSPTEPGSTPLLTGLRLMVGSVLDTFQALRVPFLLVFLIGLGSLYLGFSRRFAFSSTATALPMTARKHVDIVMSLSGAGVAARSEPGSHESVEHRFSPDETGIVTTGSRSMLRGEVWVEVETPEGDAWVNAEFLTEQIPEAVFAEDSRPTELVDEFVEQIYRSGDLLGATGGHDLHVAYYGPPVRFGANSLKSLLRGASVYWWWQPEGDTPKHQGTFDETIGESLTAAYRGQEGHVSVPDLPIPREFVNMHSLRVGTDDHWTAWRVFFRYENDEPSIAGLMRESQPNPAAVHGRIDMQAV